MIVGQLYRLKVTLPLTHIREVRDRYGEIGQRMLLRDVGSRVEALGFSDVGSVMQDPTSQTHFAVVARCQSGSAGQQTTILRIDSATPINDRDALGVYVGPPFDPGLTAEECLSISYALHNEENPRHLNGFATTLEPFFPFASTLLRAKCLLYEACREHLLSPQDRDAGCQQILAYLAAPRVRPENEHVLNMLRGNVVHYARMVGLPEDAIADELKRAVVAIVARFPPESLTRFPIQILEAAPHAARDFLPGIQIADPNVLNVLCPVTGQEGFVSPASLQLALAATKPQTADVANPDEANRLISVLLGQSPPDKDTPPNVLMKAQAQLERALRALERRRWIEYYRKTVQLENES